MKRAFFHVCSCFILTSFLPLSAEVRLPRIFGDHMVVPRDTSVKIWGTADPGENVSVQLAGRRAATTAGPDGTWQAVLSSLKADGRSHEMVVKGTNEVVLEDVVIGDVWLGSGQSNMEWPLRNTEKGKEFIEAADHPNIRLFHITKRKSDEPKTDVAAAWEACTPRTVDSFSAVLYHFGKKLHEEVDVPIGLINSSWGGSPIEPWTVTNEGAGKMYNAMIAPITDFGIRGVIWYQGETNVIEKNGLNYFNKMRDLITGWRGAFGNDKLPFYFVQLAPWNNERYEKGELPAVWEAQCAALKMPNTGMAVTIDLVEDLKDIHPRNKHDVGERLARWALAKHYGSGSRVYSGPLYKAMRVEGDRIRLAFAHLADGLETSNDKPLNEFEIAGSDGRFVIADAVIDGRTVLVRGAGIKNPTQVRFAWHRAAQPNLVNSEGLPASPFQTENWTGGTGE